MENKWPSESLVPGFRRDVESYRDHVNDLSLRLIKGLSVALGHPPTHLNDLVHSPMYVNVSFIPEYAGLSYVSWITHRKIQRLYLIAF